MVIISLRELNLSTPGAVEETGCIGRTFFVTERTQFPKSTA